MSYYGTGDYYMAGGGLFSFLGKAVGTVAKGIGSLGIPVVSGIASQVGNALAPPAHILTAPGSPLILPPAPGAISLSRPTGPGAQIVPVPGAKGVLQRLVPGGASGYMLKKRRRMNVANPKALRRAIRREAGFVKLARRALKGTGYHIGRTHSRGRAPITVRENVRVSRG